MEILEKLNYILNCILEVNNEPIVHNGLSKELIIEKLSNAGIPSNEDLIELYQWHDGIVYLNAFLGFCSLEDAIRLYKAFESFKTEFPEFKWEPSWFPILDLNGDVQILIDVNDNRLASIDMAGCSEEVIADHYINYVDAIFEVFKSKKYSFCPDGDFIELDEDCWNSQLKKYNIKPAWN